jgi:photosystem II stability/assembly factor-like uncharacterized protein
MNRLFIAHLRRAIVAATFALVAIALANAIVLAGLSVRTTNASNQAALDLLAPPTNVTTTHDGNHMTNPQEVDLSWTASTSSYVSGYEILRAVDGASACGPFSTVGNVSGATTTSFADNTANDSASPPQLNTQYCYQVLSVFSQWSATSKPSNVALSMPPTAATDTTGNGTVFYGAAYMSGSDGFAVGSGGAIIATSSGTSWTAQTSGTTHDLLADSFTSKTVGWAVGRSGTILDTTDGSTWAPQTSGTSVDLYGVAAVDTSNVWAVGDGGTILFFNGTSWTPQTSNTSANLRAVAAADTTHVWAVGAGGVIDFYNGTVWSRQTSGTSNDLLGAVFITSSTGWAVGAAGTILVTSNSGTNWTAQTSGTSNQLNAVATSSNDLWAVGADGTLDWDQARSTAVTGAWATGSAPPGFNYDLHGTGGFDGCKFVAVGEAAQAIDIASGNSNCSGSTWTPASITGLSTGSSYSLTSTDLARLASSADSPLYETRDGWPSSFPTGCATKSVRFTFSPSFLDTATISKVVVTISYEAATGVASMSAHLLVSADGGSTYTAFPLAAPTTSLQTQTVDVSTVITSRATLSNMVGCFQATGSTPYSMLFDLIHADVN